MDESESLEEAVEHVESPKKAGGGGVMIEYDAGEGYIILVRRFIKTHGLVYDVASNSYFWLGINHSLKNLSRQIHLHLKVDDRRLDKELIYEALRAEAQIQRKTAIEGLKQRLCFAPRKSDDMLRRWLAGLLTVEADTEEFENCVVVLKQWIWLVQRALLGRPQKWHIMPIFWGGQGSGKSTQVAHFLGPLGSFAQDATFQIFIGQFDQMPMHWSFALFLDEMDRAERAEDTAIKRAISSDFIPGRAMFSDDGRRLRRNASFIACTNLLPPHGLRDTTGARRFYSLECKRQPWVPGGEREQFFKSIHYLDIWLCVDPEGPPPFQERRNAIMDQQNLVNRARSVYEEFLEERCEVMKAPDGSPDKARCIHFRRVTEHLAEYIKERGLRFSVPPYRELAQTFVSLGIPCIKRSNVHYALGLRIRDMAEEALLTPDEIDDARDVPL